MHVPSPRSIQQLLKYIFIYSLDKDQGSRPNDIGVAYILAQEKGSLCLSLLEKTGQLSQVRKCCDPGFLAAQLALILVERHSEFFGVYANPIFEALFTKNVLGKLVEQIGMHGGHALVDEGVYLVDDGGIKVDSRRGMFPLNGLGNLA